MKNTILSDFATLRSRTNELDPTTTMKMLFHIVGLLIAMTALPGIARAVPQLLISDGTSTITIIDGGLGDANSAAGAVTWIGSIGVWTVNVDSGLTYPSFGTSDAPRMNLSFQDSSSGAGTLTLMFSEIGFTSPQGGWTNQSIGGTTSGSVMYDIYGAASGPTRNIAFDTTRRLGTLGPLTGVFSVPEEAHNFILTSNPFSLTQVITITHAGAGVTSGSAILRIPDAGTTATLLGLSLLGLVAVRSRLA